MSAQEEGKKEQVTQMFDHIAPRYDFLNHFLSAHMDKIWRRKTVNQLRERQLDKVLDVATGTGDLAIVLYQHLQPNHITGIDISDGMLNIGRQKITQKKLTQKISLLHGDSENIPFESNSFDAVTCAFGVRNFENLETGLQEMYRALKPGGKAVILEFSMPRNKIFRNLYRFYFFRILPLVGRLVSKNTQAYYYLPDSVQSFPNYGTFTAKMDECGFSKSNFRSLSGGIACIYTGEKSI